jgi:serine/threonine protein kinase
MNNSNSKKYVVRKLVYELFFFFCAAEYAVGSTDSHELLRETRCVASNILGANPEEMSRDLADIYVATLSQGAEEIFNSKFSTIKLAESATNLLRERLSQFRAPLRSEDTIWQEAINKMDTFRAQQSAVNAGKFRDRNPIIKEPLATLPKIDVSRVESEGEKLGEGGYGRVYSYAVEKAGQPCDIIVKIPTQHPNAQLLIDVETAAGDDLRERFEAMGGDSLVSDYQGLAVVVVPIKLPNGIAIQERIQGSDGRDAICGKMKQRGSRLVQTQFPARFFSNGYVGDPREAVMLAAGLVFGLHAIHEAGKVHHDLKLENIMVGEGDGGLKFWIIDLGGTANIGGAHGIYTSNGAPEFISPPSGTAQDREAQTSYDIYTLGTMLPSLFFGRAGESLESAFYSSATDAPSDFVQFARSHSEAEIGQALLQTFQVVNAAMQGATKKSYPDHVLKRIAAMAADCLSMDPKKRPTAEQVLLFLQNIGLSDWKYEQCNIQDVPKLTREQAEIQDKFPWIRGKAVFKGDAVNPDNPLGPFRQFVPGSSFGQFGLDSSFGQFGPDSPFWHYDGSLLAGDESGDIL